MFNPFRDHDLYKNKNPKDMSLDELRMLLEIRRLDLKLEWEEVQKQAKLGARIFRVIRNSGIIEKITSRLSPELSPHDPPQQ